MLSRTVVEKRNGSCGDDADLAAQRRELHVAYVHAVDEHAARVDVVEARHERGERRLAGTGVADERDRRPRVEREVEVLEHRPARQVGERDVLEADRAVAGGQLDRARAVGHVLRLVEDLEDPLARRRRPLRLADPHPERAERHDEHGEVEVEGRRTSPIGERAVRDHPRADEQDGRLREQRQEREERHVRRALPVRADRLREERLVAAGELRLLGRLLRERLDDVDADDVLLRDRRDVGELLLHVAERRVRDVAVAVGDHDEERRHREHDERELPLEEEEDDRSRRRR